MASSRRGGRGGLQAPELRGTLGTLLKTTLAQAGVVRDVLERGAREGRTRLDEALLNRRRTDALAKLGEIVLGLIRRGEVDVEELPEIRNVLARLDELDRGGAGSSASDRPDAAQWSPETDWREPAGRPPAGPQGKSFGHGGRGGSGDGDYDDDLTNYMHPGDVPAKESR